MLTKAITLAVSAHGKQLDKAGKPYILHPLRVMLHFETEELQIIGVLPIIAVKPLSLDMGI